MQVLTVNAGSSSLKLRLLDPDDRLQGSVDLAVRGGEIDADELDRAVSGMPAPDAVGHRVVHGGDYRTRGPQDRRRPFAFAANGLRRLDIATKEWIGLLAYRLAGYSDALLPGPEDAGKPSR